MKRFVRWTMVASLGLMPHAGPLAQQPTNTVALQAALIAGQRDMEERYQRLSAAITDLQETQATLQKRLSALAEEIQSVREDLANQANRSFTNFATRDELRRLVERLQEMDKNREEDKKLILENIRKLAPPPTPEPAPPPAPAPAPVVTPPPKKPAPIEPVVTPAPPPSPQRGYEYEVKEDDTLAAIVAAYRQSGVKITVEQVIKANPGLKPKNLKIGQKLFIPEVSPP